MTKNNEINQITEGVIWKQLLIFFFPILIGTFFQQLYNTVDAVIVGRFVGKEALSAVGGSTSSLINLIVGFFVGVSTGATVIISQHYGAKNKKGVSDSIGTAIALSVAGGLFLMCFCIFFAKQVLVWMDTPADTLSQSVLYMQIYALGLVPELIYNMGSGILRRWEIRKTVILSDRFVRGKHCIRSFVRDRRTYGRCRSGDRNDALAVYQRGDGSICTEPQTGRIFPKAWEHTVSERISGSDDTHRASGRDPVHDLRTVQYIDPVRDQFVWDGYGGRRGLASMPRSTGSSGWS